MRLFLTHTHTLVDREKREETLGNVFSLSFQLTFIAYRCDALTRNSQIKKKTTSDMEREGLEEGKALQLVEKVMSVT